MKIFITLKDNHLVWVPSFYWQHDITYRELCNSDITFCQYSNNTDYFQLLKEMTFQLINNHQDAFDSFGLIISITKPTCSRCLTRIDVISFGLMTVNLTTQHIFRYSRINSTKSPASRAGNVS